MNLKPALVLVASVIFLVLGVTVAQTSLTQPMFERSKPLSREQLELFHGSVAEVEEIAMLPREHMGRLGFFLDYGRRITFDRQGRPVSTVSWNGAGETTYSSHFTYDGDTILRELNAPGLFEAYYYIYENGLLTEVQEQRRQFSPARTTESHTHFYYDSLGRVIRFERTGSNPDNIGQSLNYVYSEEGSDVVIYAHEDENPEQPAERYRYSQYNELIESGTRSSRTWVIRRAEYNQFSLPTAVITHGDRLSVVYTYEFDEVGNWIYRQQFDRSGRLVHAVQRNISYFE